jgi:hypothetical protein
MENPIANNQRFETAKYRVWKQKSTIEIAYKVIPDIVKRFNSEIGNESLTIEQTKAYLYEVMRQ